MVDTTPPLFGYAATWENGVAAGDYNVTLQAIDETESTGDRAFQLARRLEIVVSELYVHKAKINIDIAYI